MQRNVGVEQGLAQPTHTASPIAVIDDARQRVVVTAPDDTLCDTENVESRPMRHAASVAVE
ncbi:hypothetical protein [Dokdonella sp.]|uniref:hypothetical protein n=1 Tax=Dokdonella sp. TaxID=2291710 RepID=UPI001B0E4BEC|nr:hypothetical protein [Dokdonella sp.]MBO9663423.1 hypothetical protein [Dokdonella sp.]